MGGRMRWEMIQNRMSPLPRVRVKCLPKARARKKNRASATALRSPPGNAGIAGGGNDQQSQRHEHHDVAELGLVLDAGQRVGRHGADGNAEGR